jgi:hypothetical protein
VVDRWSSEEFETALILSSMLDDLFFCVVGVYSIGNDSLALNK